MTPSDQRVYETWLEKTPVEDQTRFFEEFKFLREALEVIEAQILSLPKEQLWSDAETVLPLLDQWTAITGELLANPIFNLETEDANDLWDKVLGSWNEVDAIHAYLTQAIIIPSTVNAQA